MNKSKFINSVRIIKSLIKMQYLNKGEKNRRAMKHCKWPNSRKLNSKMRINTFFAITPSGINNFLQIKQTLKIRKNLLLENCLTQSSGKVFSSKQGLDYQEIMQLK